MKLEALNEHENRASLRARAGRDALNVNLRVHGPKAADCAGRVALEEGSRSTVVVLGQGRDKELVVEEGCGRNAIVFARDEGFGAQSRASEEVG